MRIDMTGIEKLGTRVLVQRGKKKRLVEVVGYRTSVRLSQNGDVMRNEPVDYVVKWKFLGQDVTDVLPQSTIKRAIINKKS